MNRTTKVAAVQDLSGLGRCSLSVVLPVLSVMGAQCCPLPTAVLSAHTAFPAPEAAAFQDLPFQAGAKTGSAQVTGEENANAVLVCFAPYDDPQIALAVVVEQGGSGAALGEVAAQVLQSYVP